jgi:putative proteasome-type protease
MTYCVGLLLADGLVMVSDSRTNAGVDHIATFRKMSVWENPGERTIVMLASGNLAITQAVVNLLNEGHMLENSADALTMMHVPSMFDAARLVGAAIREVFRSDGPALKAQGTEFNCAMILGGQIRGRRLRLFHVYSAGNFIEATPETPYFQVGETKYGKPILDRVVHNRTSLVEAAKCCLISMDSTLRSNISVGLPIDVAIYKRDALKLGVHERIDDSNPYFNDIRKRWSEGLRSVFQQLPDPHWTI